MAPTPHSSSEETPVLVDPPRVTRSKDRTVQKSRLTQRRYRERQKLQMEEYRQRVAQLTSQLGQLSTAKSTLEDRVRLLEKVVEVQKVVDVQAKEPEQQATQVQEQMDAEEEISLALSRFARTVRQSKEPLKKQQKWTSEDVRQVKMDYVSQCAVFLAAGAGSGNKEALEQLERYVIKCRYSRWEVSTKQNWRTLAQMLAAKPQQAMPPELLAKMEKAAKLSSDQKRDLASAHGAYLVRSARFAEERASILASLQGATNANEPHLGCCVQPGPVATMTSSALVEASRASEELKQNLRLDQKSRLAYDAAFSSVVTPLQEANTVVELYPNTFEYQFHFELGNLLCRQAEEEDDGLVGGALAGGLDQQAPPQPQLAFSITDPATCQLPADFVAAAAGPPLVDLPGGLPEADIFNFDDMALEKAGVWQEFFSSPLET